jgi:O-acetyl-ADP-ribose deacetylase (regulator of RNase III)
MNKEQSGYWTNKSVLRFAGNNDPINVITEKARDVVMSAVQNGWQGPPFDPFKLANFLSITTTPRDDVMDARIVPGPSRNPHIEFNPNRSLGRIRFSIAHEIAHTLFEDFSETVRNRKRTNIRERDDWQLELLCNLAAAELLMPTGSEIDPHSQITIENILRLQRLFNVSTEAISLRLAKITLEACTIFAAARTEDNDNVGTYRIDYNMPSRSSAIRFPIGFKVKNTTISECSAIGFTAIETEKRFGDFKNVHIEWVGIPPYPGKSYPRVIGVMHGASNAVEPLTMALLRGNALEPRQNGVRILAHIVNDKTPNWGAGFTRAVRNKYPEVQEDFRDWVRKEPAEFKLGAIHTSTTNDGLFVVNMVAQHGYGESIKPRIRYGALSDCLRSLAQLALSKQATVHIPRIGTGYAGGNWSFIAELIGEELVQKGVPTTIYALPDHQPSENQGTLNLFNYNSEIVGNLK